MRSGSWIHTQVSWQTPSKVCLWLALLLAGAEAPGTFCAMPEKEAGAESGANTCAKLYCARASGRSFPSEPEDPSTIASVFDRPSAAPGETSVSAGECGCAGSMRTCSELGLCRALGAKEDQQAPGSQQLQWGTGLTRASKYNVCAGGRWGLSHDVQSSTLCLILD